jgi:hypothetical protein
MSNTKTKTLPQIKRDNTKLAQKLRLNLLRRKQKTKSISENKNEDK